MWAIAPRCDSSGLSTLSQIHSGNTGAAGPARPISKLRPRDGACATFKIYLKFLPPWVTTRRSRLCSARRQQNRPLKRKQV